MDFETFLERALGGRLLLLAVIVGLCMVACQTIATAGYVLVEWRKARQAERTAELLRDRAGPFAGDLDGRIHSR